MSHTERESASTGDSPCAAANEPPAGTVILTGTLHRVRKGNGHAFAPGENPKPLPPTVRKPARIARMLAFAHKLKQTVEKGEYESPADAARCLNLTRGRISQLLDLTLLAPDLQEAILFLERVDGVEPLSERRMREVVKCEEWGRQRERWGEI